MKWNVVYVYLINALKHKFVSKSRLVSHIVGIMVSILFPIFTWYSFIEDKNLAMLYIQKILINYLFFEIYSYMHYEYVLASIVSGKLNLELLKPENILKTFFYKFFATFLSKIILLFIPLIIIYIIFNNVIVFTLYNETFLDVVILLYFYSTILFLSFLIGIVIGATSFWIGEIWPIRLFFILAGGALAGTWFPFKGNLYFMSFLPLGLLGDGCTSFLTIYRAQRINYIYAFTIWMVVFIFLTKILWMLGQNKYEAEGG